ncbi:MAG: hypothetical protein ABI175_11180 [Polyangiales bacterium]
MALALLLGGCRERRSAGVEGVDTARPPPSFRRDVVPFLAKHCAQARCHGDEQDESADLDLRAGAAYRQLVGAGSPGRSGALRVVAGHPEKSFLVDKLTGKLARYEGERMPIDPDTKKALPETEEQRTFVEQVLVPWIAAGAKDD